MNPVANTHPSPQSVPAPMQAPAFAYRVLDWYDRHGRKDLPWQVPRSPYRVWISEIMLQQTQVATVIPYFRKFVDRFAGVEPLAAAPLDEVIAHWAGLGYYARARNLHRAANRLWADHQGQFPQDLDALQQLPGVGRSTAGAILSLGLGGWAPILDGNVKRVLCRHAGLHGWPGSPAMLRTLWALSERLTPRERTADYNQAMMDLGALVCTRGRPRCEACPLAADCRARREELTAVIPSPRPRNSLPVRHCWLLVLLDSRGRVYLEKRPPAGIWGGLYSLPEFDDPASLELWCRSRGLATADLEVQPTRRHTFSHFHLDYTPTRLVAVPMTGVGEALDHGWFEPEALPGLPAPVKSLLSGLAAG